VLNRKVLPRQRWYWWLVLVIGYLLSPLSWWNDLFVNLPLAYLFGSALSLVSKKLFAPGMIFGYWLSNLLGFFLMHRAGWKIAVKDGSSGNRRRAILLNILTALGYTVLVVVLILTGLLKPPAFIHGRMDH
jgi:Sec-independent protein secretion pathway component TatC